MEFWVEEPLIVKIFLLVLTLMAVPAIARLGKVASWLYFSSRKASPEELSRLSADDLSNYALRNSAFGKARLSHHRSIVEAVPRDGTFPAFRAGEIRFTYLCERSLMEIDTVKMVTGVVFLLSWIMAAYGAIPTYLWVCNDSNLPSHTCQMQALDQVLKTLCAGLGLSVGLHVLSARVDRSLRKRRAEWMYFFATMRSDSSGTQ
jgi:hypothetical protein